VVEAEAARAPARRPQGQAKPAGTPRPRRRESARRRRSARGDLGSGPEAERSAAAGQPTPARCVGAERQHRLAAGWRRGHRCGRACGPTSRGPPGGLGPGPATVQRASAPAGRGLHSRGGGDAAQAAPLGLSSHGVNHAGDRGLGAVPAVPPRAADRSSPRPRGWWAAVRERDPARCQPEVEARVRPPPIGSRQGAPKARSGAGRGACRMAKALELLRQCMPMPSPTPRGIGALGAGPDRRGDLAPA
jgi:hypothetical protein